MNQYIQALILIFMGILLLWFGYSLFFGLRPRSSALGFAKSNRKQGSIGASLPGDPKTCPVCSAKLLGGELVKSSAFPSLTGKDRLMHIQGCVYCLRGERERICPVCGATLDGDEILIARMFDRPGRNHDHVLGCSRCRGTGPRAKKRD
jgi:RNA polymerase subunit RPABC4/transcription elongation factor Spt4